MSGTQEDALIEARVSALRDRVAAHDLPRCERCGLTLVRGVPKVVRTLDDARRRGRGEAACTRPGCRYTGRV
jgi:hypothetical protein